jgi:phosphatidylglycerophosphate synthase
MVSKEIENSIKNYSYKSNDHSYLSRYYLPLCKFILEFVPVRLSPNLITLFGLGAVLLSTISLLFTVSPFSFLFCAICLLTYQLCDTLDGLQGKRTGMYNNCTTELFDHGCDSIVVTLSTINFALIYPQISQSLLITSVISSTCLFYFPTWEHLHTKTMNFRGGLCNPTESLFALELFYLALAIQPSMMSLNVISFIIFVQALHALYVVCQSIRNVIMVDYMSKCSKIITIVPFVLCIFLLFPYSDTGHLTELVGILLTWNYAVLELIWSEISNAKYNLNGFLFVFLKQLLVPYEFMTNIIYYVYKFNGYIRIMCQVLNMDNFMDIPSTNTHKPLISGQSDGQN